MKIEVLVDHEEHTYMDIQYSGYKIDPSGRLVFIFMHKVQDVHSHDLSFIQKLARIKRASIRTYNGDEHNESLSRTINCLFMFYELDDESLIETFTFEVGESR